MTITYRTSGAWGAGKGGNLTPAEVDTNFHSLVGLIGDVADGLVPSEIEDITLVGSQLTFVMSDARVFGPYTLPRAAFRFVGAWNASAAYLGNDLVTTADGLFLVLQAHTSAATFDPDRVIGGEPVYQLVFREPRSQVYSVGTAELTPALDQVWGYFRCAGECVVIVPTTANVAFPVGSELHFRQVTAGLRIYFTPQVGVTLLVPEGRMPETALQGATVTLKKVGSETWDVFGTLAEAT
jgi:hypothetical protein